MWCHHYFKNFFVGHKNVWYATFKIKFYLLINEKNREPSITLVQVLLGIRVGPRAFASKVLLSVPTHSVFFIFPLTISIVKNASRNKRSICNVLSATKVQEYYEMFIPESPKVSRSIPSTTINSKHSVDKYVLHLRPQMKGHCFKI